MYHHLQDKRNSRRFAEYFLLFSALLFPLFGQTPLSITPGDFLPATIVTSGTALNFVFTGNAGDQWAIELQNPNTSARPCMEVRDPGNNLVTLKIGSVNGSPCSSDGIIKRSFSITRAGLHTIRFYPQSQDVIINAIFACNGSCPPGPTNFPRAGVVPPRNFNSTFSGSGLVTPMERFHLYRFYGEAGQRLTLEVAATNKVLDPCIRTYSPTGIFIDLTCSSQSTVRQTMSPTRTGWHYVYVQEKAWTRDMQYDIRLACSPTCKLPLTSQGSHFLPIAPCRAADTRDSFAIPGNSFRNFTLESCNVPSNATAVALNVTLVPTGPLGYLSIWPAGQSQPVVSTMNALDGRIKANASFVGLGNNKAVSVYVTDNAHVILDVNGYFVPAGTGGALAFYPTAPCRVVDTRNTGGVLPANSTRLINAGTCLPSHARAYSLNVTAVPSGPLGFLTLWPDGPAQPRVSTLNALTGTVVANAAIVSAGTGGAINAFVTDRSHLIIDANGYFALPGSPGELAFYPVQPCRIFDTRNAAGAFGGPRMEADSSREFTVPASSCGVPASAQAYVTNATVVPSGPFGFLTMWPGNQNRPTVSTLNALDGALTSNAAILPAGPNGVIRMYASSPTNLLLDISGYFAP
jgi:hypothetical protein